MKSINKKNPSSRPERHPVIAPQATHSRAGFIHPNFAHWNWLARSIDRADVSAQD